MCALRMRRDGRSTSSLPFGLRHRFSDQDEMYTFTPALSEDRQVFVQERDLVGENLLAHGISVEIEVVARVTTQLPARRPLGYLPRKLLGGLVVAFGHAHQHRHLEPMRLVAGSIPQHAKECSWSDLVAPQ